MLDKIANLPDEARLRLARQIKYAQDFELPHLSYWNYDPCKDHSSIQEGSQATPPCRMCGILPRKHQRIGIAWAFTTKKCLIADTTGSGKSVAIAGILAMAFEAGELDDQNRKVLIVVSTAVHQLKKDLCRMLPTVPVTMMNGPKLRRIEKIRQKPWQVVLTTYQMLNNDLGLLRDYNIYTMFLDDVDPVRSPETNTAKTINELAAKAERVVITNATVINKRLFDLYWMLYPLGGSSIFGNPSQFERRHVRYHYKKAINPKSGREVMMKNIAGYRLMEEITEKIDPIVIRRTAVDMDDVDMPALLPNHVFLDLYPAQRRKYQELQEGVVRILKEEGGMVTKTRAHNAFLLGQQICDGLAVLGEVDGPNSSIKFDWIIDKVVDGDLSDEKVVIFLQFQNGIRALNKRFQDAGVGTSIIWGVDNKTKQFEAQERFWNDDNCRVVLGTSAMMRSINLQNSRHLIAVDTIPSPAQMSQLSGRIKRDGSAYHTVYFHSLLTNDTQEERYLIKIQREAAVSDVIFAENNDLYTADFSSEELLQMISG